MTTQKLHWTILAICLMVLSHESCAAPSERVKRDDQALDDVSFELNPVAAEELYVNELDRGKRSHDAGFGTKNAIIGFVFGTSKASASASVPSTGRQALASATKPPITTTTDDTPDFDRNKVSLDIPDQLFGSSFSTVTNVSKIFGDLIMNTARRYSQFVQYFKPILGKTLTVKGLYAPSTTTTTESNSL